MSRPLAWPPCRCSPHIKHFAVNHLVHFAAESVPSPPEQPFGMSGQPDLPHRGQSSISTRIRPWGSTNTLYFLGSDVYLCVTDLFRGGGFTSWPNHTVEAVGSAEAEAQGASDPVCRPIPSNRLLIASRSSRCSTRGPRARFATWEGAFSVLCSGAAHRRIEQ